MSHAFSAFSNRHLCSKAPNEVGRPSFGLQVSFSWFVSCCSTKLIVLLRFLGSLLLKWQQQWQITDNDNNDHWAPSMMTHRQRTTTATYSRWQRRPLPTRSSPYNGQQTTDNGWLMQRLWKRGMASVSFFSLFLMLTIPPFPCPSCEAGEFISVLYLV
jgi:hypothetical protein